MSNTANTTAAYRLPAEWEPQKAVMLTWPHAGTDWAPMLGEIEEVFLTIASEIRKREKLIVVAPEGVAESVDCDARLTTDTNDTWARDHGFLTLVPSDKTATEGKVQPVLLDFRFNGWGEKFPAEKDNAINRQLYDRGIVCALYSTDNTPHDTNNVTYHDCLDFVLEGGSIESDGQGTVFTTTGCLMAPHRNQPLRRQDIEARLKQELKAGRIVWLDHGELTGDDTDGHIDTLVRIAPDYTLLYVGCNDEHDEQYRQLMLMKEQLSTLRTTSGKSYRLLALPMPRPIYDEGQRLPATYANFLVINGAVLCPTYGQPDLDREALATIGTAFPDREVVGIDCLPVIRQHGSLHCLTMQFPEIL